MLYTLTVFEVDAIVSFKASFGLPVEKVGQALAECDMGCPFSKLKSIRIHLAGRKSAVTLAKHG